MTSRFQSKYSLKIIQKINQLIALVRKDILVLIPFRHIQTEETLKV